MRWISPIHFGLLYHCAAELIIAIRQESAILVKHPIWTFTGNSDDKISIKETEPIVKRLKKYNGKIRFTKLKDRGYMKSNRKYMNG